MASDIEPYDPVRLPELHLDSDLQHPNSIDVLSIVQVPVEGGVLLSRDADGVSEDQ